jgi:lysophospholipase L1-like esterase
MFLIALIIGNINRSDAQSTAEKEIERMISASREGASPLYFNVNDGDIPMIKPGTFDYPKETVERQGLGNFFSKLNNKQPVTIGYIGGSITQAPFGYRLQSAKYIQTLYPNVKMQFLNAGVAGTGADLGACRLQEQILAHHPDLVFIEFAVNGAYQEGMEGMIRQIIRNNPKADICLIYTISGGQTKEYVNGAIPENIKGLDKIADYYGLPSIHLGMEAALMEKKGTLIWKSDTKSITDKVVFSLDGIHPTLAGGNLYASSIARGMVKMKKQTKLANHLLPKALFPDNWEKAKMFEPLQAGEFSNDWQKILIDDNAQLKQFRSWFPYLMYSEKAGAFFNITFIGDMIGFYDLGGPDVGQISIELDGKPVSLQEASIKGYHCYKVLPAISNGIDVINRFNSFCNNRYRGQYEFIETGPGKHTVTFRLSSLKADKKKILGIGHLDDITNHTEIYQRTSLYFGKILVKGEINKK